MVLLYKYFHYIFSEGTIVKTVGIAGAWEHFKVGLFHEIDHSRLSPISPVQLKSVRIGMVLLYYYIRV